MIENIVKKIMVNGIDTFSKKYQCEDKEVQIKVANNPEGLVFYEICQNYKSKEEVNFLQIMGKKLDIFGYESITSPFIKKSLEELAIEKKIDVNQICCFILKIKDNKIGLAFYNSKTNENLKQITLTKFLENVGF
jgi:hypothetical protein